MKILRYIAVSIFVGAAAMLINTGRAPIAHAAFTSPAFTCDGSFYQLRTPGGGNTALYKLNLTAGGTFSETQIGPLNPTLTGMNGLGYNPLDGYLYAFSSTANGGADYHLFRINDAGVITDMGLVGGITSGGNPSVAGATFGPDGTLYGIQASSAGLAERLIKINIATMSATVVTMSQPIPQGDIAFDPTTGILYAIEAGAGKPLHTIDITTGAVSSIGTGSQTAGSAFFDAQGNLYAGGNNSGYIYYVNKTTGQYTRVYTGPGATSSDGATCAFPSINVDTIKSQSSLSYMGGATFRVAYQFGIKSSGADIAENVQLVDDLSKTFATNSPTISVVNAPAVTSGSCTANTSYNGSTDSRLLAGTDDLSTGQECIVTLTVDVTYSSLAAVPSAPQTNQAYASAASSSPNDGHYFTTDALGNPIIVSPPNMTNGDYSTNATVFPSTANGDIPSTTDTTFSLAPDVSSYMSVALTGDVAANGSINPGDTVTYTVTYRNTGTQDDPNYQIIFTLPAGLDIVPGTISSSVSGAGQTATVNSSYDGTGQVNLLTAPTTLVANGMVTITFQATVSATSGTLTTQATGDGDASTPASTDTLDNSAGGDCSAPAGITVPVGSVTQTCTAGVDPTVLSVSSIDGTIVSPPPSIITSPALSGTVDNPTATVTVTVQGNTYPATNNGDGTWTLPAGTIAALTPGSYPATATFTDAFSNTATDTGTITVLRTDAEIPTVNDITWIGGHPIVTGTYDSTNSQSLTIEINGVNYVLGSSPELTTSGDGWTLNLSNISPELNVGPYSVAATITTRGGATLADATAQEVTILGSTVINTVTNPAAQVTLANTGVPVWALGIAGLVCVGAAISLIVRKAR